MIWCVGFTLLALTYCSSCLFLLGPYFSPLEIDEDRIPNPLLKVYNTPAVLRLEQRSQFMHLAE